MATATRKSKRSKNHNGSLEVQRNRARHMGRVRSPTDASTKAVYHEADTLGLVDHESKLTEFDTEDGYLSLTEENYNEYNNEYNNGYSEYTETMCDDYNIEDTATSVAVEISTPFQLKNQLSNVSELFNMTDNMRQATEPQLMTVDDVDVDETLCESSVSHSHYAPTETTETATYRDGRSRRHSNSGQIIIEYNEDEDILPAILEQMDSKNHDKNVEQHNQNLKHMNANGGMDDILGLDSTMYIEDAMSCSTHSHSDMRPQQIQARYSSGLALKQSDSNNAHTTHDAIYDSNNEMDEDFYDLLSDAVCDLFIKLDTKNKKAVSDDIIKIGFALLDINLSDNEFNMFIAEITNHKTRKSKMIRLDMLRSFVLNIQNKNYHHTLNRIRSVIIDGLLSAQPSVGASHSNSMKRSSNNSPNQRSKPKLSRHPSHSPPPPHMNNAHTQAIRARHSVVVTPHHSHAHTHAPRGQTVSLSTLPTISSPTVTMNQHFSDPTMSTLPALPNLPSLPSQPQTKYASRSRKKNKQHQQPPTHTMQLQWRPHITDHDENGACQYDLLLCTLKYSLISTAVEFYHTSALDIDTDQFYVYVAKSAPKAAFQYLFESYFDYMGHYAEYMSLKAFEAGLRHCGITFDREDICIISFGQLAQAFTHSATNSKGKAKKRKLFITRATFVSWLMEAIYSATNIHYVNYTKHYHQYFKWIENDLFSLVDEQTYINRRRRSRRSRGGDHDRHHQKQNKSKIKTKQNKKKTRPKSGRVMKHSSMNYHNPVVLPQTVNKIHKKKKRHKSHIIKTGTKM
eukprot:940445_1